MQSTDITRTSTENRRNDNKVKNKNATITFNRAKVDDSINKPACAIKIKRDLDHLLTVVPIFGVLQYGTCTAAAR